MKTKREIRKIIVHCTATPAGKDFTVDQIRNWHLHRGFSDIGYHYIVGLDGSIETGRDESRAGAHCMGHNRDSIGVCYVGGCDGETNPLWAVTPKDTRTEAQKLSLLKLLKELKSRYPGAKIYGHRDFAKKACPSFDAREEYKDL